MLMTWDTFLGKLAKSEIGYQGIDVDEQDGHIIIHTDLRVKRDGGGREYIAEIDCYADDVEVDDESEPHARRLDAEENFMGGDK